MDLMVLVDSDVVVQPREGFIDGKIRKASNRLAIAYGPDVSVKDTRKATSDLGVKPVFGFIDRELDSRGIDRVGIIPDLDQAPGKVVECGSAVIENVSNQEAPFNWELPDAPYDKSPVTRLFVQLFPERETWFRMGVEKPDDVGFELAAMDYRPAKLGPSASEGFVVGHALPLEEDAKEERPQADTGDSARKGRTGGDTHPDKGRGLP
jgi:hypothetical protein